MTLGVPNSSGDPGYPGPQGLQGGDSGVCHREHACPLEPSTTQKPYIAIILIWMGVFIAYNDDIAHMIGKFLQY